MALVVAFVLGRVGTAAAGFLTLKDGYFWDGERGEYFLPRGIAYQTFNPEVGATQSPEQIGYDFEQIATLRANSVRCEFVWSQIEVGDDVYDWTKADKLIAEAERLGLRLFVIIGFQYPPKWFPKEWRAVNDRVLSEPGNEAEWRSDVLNYEHPDARLAYSNHLARVTQRYRDSPAIAAWILGNEYAYFDLWEDLAKYVNRRMLGHDPYSLAAFRGYLRERYAGNIATLNANWRTAYASFDEIPMPGRFPEDRNSPGHFEVYQWRKQSIGDFIALGARAARANDPNHLTTYSMVGGIYNGLDANFTAEDGRAIVTRCLAAGVPLDFWSINNYAWARLGSEMRSGDFGIAKYQALTGLPVMISETGHSSTENLFDLGLSDKRQPRALQSQLWEAFMSGAIGLHIFTWNDRERFTEEYFLRERGFGFMDPRRRPKPEVYERVAAFFRQADNLGVERLFGGSRNPPRDVQFFWSDDTDLGWSIANQENAMLWGGLKRLGLQPGIIGDDEFARGAYTNGAALLVSRGFALRPEYFGALRTDVLGAGIHLHANADFPGQFNPWHGANGAWRDFMRNVFGLDVAGAWTGVDLWATTEGGRILKFDGSAPAGVLLDPVFTWKIWHGHRAVAGRTLARHRGVDGSQASPLPALQVVDHPRAKAAINTFALGDLDIHDAPRSRPWEFRIGWLRQIYQNEFGLRPAINVTGQGVDYVFKDYRLTRGGGVLLSFLNAFTNRAQVVLSVSTGLLAGRRIEHISRGVPLAVDGGGSVTVDLEPDECAVLYAYETGEGGDRSLVSPSPDKVWFTEVPGALVPGGLPHRVQVTQASASGAGAVHLAFEQLAPVRRTLQQMGPVQVTGGGAADFTVSAPAAGGDAWYLPSDDGGEYALRAWTEIGGIRKAGVEVPVRVLPGVRAELPATVSAGSLRVPVVWDGIPGVTNDAPLTQASMDPLGRLEWWDSLSVGTARAVIQLEAFAGGTRVFKDQHLTPFGSGRHEFIVPAAGGAANWTWRASALRPEAYTSVDLYDSFEGRTNGALTGLRAKDPAAKSPFDPWYSYDYPPEPDPLSPVWWDEGVTPAERTHGGQAAFLILWNQPGAVNTGFGIKRPFPQAWKMPSSPTEQAKYSLSVDFKEDRGRPCVVEIQVANADDPALPNPRVLHFTKEYAPGPDGWDTIRATLADFRHPEWSPPFDPQAVVWLVCNIQLQRDNTEYLVFIDNVRFEGPDSVTSVGAPLAVFDTGAGFEPDADHDGLPDAIERGTGVFQGETDPGTSRLSADSDGDGINDGDELAAGTDPNRREDALRLEAGLAGDGTVRLRWQARAGRTYGVESAPSLDAGVPFVAEDAGIGWYAAEDRAMEISVSVSAGETRFYRLTARRP